MFGWKPGLDQGNTPPYKCRDTALRLSPGVIPGTRRDKGTERCVIFDVDDRCKGDRQRSWCTEKGTQQRVNTVCGGR